MVVGEIAVETDVVVIGGGPGGYTAALRLAQLGKSVVLIEKDLLGGVCLNRGCIPSKALIHAAEQFHGLSRLAHIGIAMSGSATFDLDKWQTWKSSVVSKMGQGIEHLCRDNGVNIVKGSAALLAANRIGVETGNDYETYKFRHAIVACGSKPLIPTIMVTDGVHILDSSEALMLNEIPASVALIGGGYIGVELGTAFAKLGCNVTIIEMGDRLLPQIPDHLAAEVTKVAGKLGIQLKTSTKVQSIAVKDDQVALQLVTGQDGEETFVYDKAIVAVGREPNTKDAGLAQAGVLTDERGYIQVNSQCRTNVPHIYAIGDVTPGPALAHRAIKQGIVAAEAICGLPSAFDTLHVPYVIFSDPQIAGVGIHREEAERLGLNVRVASFPYRLNGRAAATDDQAGFAEIIADRDSHLLLGMHAVGTHAAELICEGVVALEMGARAEDLALIVHPHPTLGEAWWEAAQAVLGHAVHAPGK